MNIAADRTRYRSGLITAEGVRIKKAATQLRINQILL